MRTSDLVRTRTAQSSVAGWLSSLEKIQRQMSTMKRINAPGDDPVGTGRLLTTKRQIVQTEQLERNVVYARGNVDFATSALDNVNNLLSEVRSKGMFGLSNVAEIDPSREVLAAEVDALLEEIAHQVSTQVNGEYIFSGSRTDRTPFILPRNGDGQITGTPEYQGDDQQRFVNVGLQTGVDAARAEVTWVGGWTEEPVPTGTDGVFGNATSNILSVAIELRDTLANKGNLTFDAQSQELRRLIAELDELRDHVLIKTAEIGAKARRVDLAENSLSDLQIHLEALRSKDEDADIAALIVDLRTTEQALQGALAVTARVSTLSLLQYLG